MGSLFGGGSGAVNASSIREANAQVEAMHARIQDLEKRVRLLTSEMGPILSSVLFLQVSEQMELLERRRLESKRRRVGKNESLFTKCL